MASLPGVRFDITGASGTQGLLSPKGSWKAYVFPRGGHAEQSSSGAVINFDSASVSGRFAVGDWIQVGLDVSTLRKVKLVGTPSAEDITVLGDNVTVAENQRIYIIGQTQPTVTGGSATYTTPESVIRKRDDDAADVYANSMVTSNSDGLIQFFGNVGTYDVIIQDGNQSNQGSIIDLPLGAVEGVSTEQASVFGATVTMNAALGVTGWATFGSTVTMNAQLGVTGHATFGSTITGHANFGVTGTALIGATATVNGALGVTGTATLAGAADVTGWATFGASVTITGAVGVTGTVRAPADITAGRILQTEGVSMTIGAGVIGVSLNADWGDAATVTLDPDSTDVRGGVQVGCAGAGIAVDPVVFVFYTGGAYTNTPFPQLTKALGPIAPTAGAWVLSLRAANVFGAQFQETPVSGNNYKFIYHIIG